MGISGNSAWSGIMRGASVIFFAYIGFDAVSTAAQEAKNPQKRYADSAFSGRWSSARSVHHGRRAADRAGELHALNVAGPGGGRRIDAIGRDVGIVLVMIWARLPAWLGDAGDAARPVARALLRCRGTACCGAGLGGSIRKFRTPWISDIAVGRDGGVHAGVLQRST